MKYTRFADIPLLTPYGNHNEDIPLEMLEGRVQQFLELGLNLNPDFQRGHVWTEEQQSRFVEYLLSGGREQHAIFFNTTSPRGFHGDFVIVDGLQRLTACRRFLANEVRVYGRLLNEFEDNLSYSVQLRFNINNLPTRKDVLRWYLEINSGGTPHTFEELERVENLLALENDRDGKKR